MKKELLLAPLCAVAALTGCTTTNPETVAVAPRDLDPASPGVVRGIGIESDDIVSMTDKMMRDILSTAIFANSPSPPQIALDSVNFRNDSSQTINKDLIINRLRVALNRSAGGRMTFINTGYRGAAEKERSLKRAGKVDVGTTGLTMAQAGADYMLGGTIASLDSRDPRTGYMQRYMQITFELFDTERGSVVWSNMYEFQRGARDDVVYR